MRKLLIITFLMLFPFIPNAAASEAENIETYGTEIDNCRQTLEEKEQQLALLRAQNPISYYNQILNEYKTLQKCYKEVTQKIFAEFYHDTAETMQQELDSFIEQTHQHYLNIYRNHKYCQKNCGTLPLIQATQSTTYALQHLIIEILQNLQNYNRTNND